MKVPPRKKRQRIAFLSAPMRPCPNCGLPARHFVSPCMGDPGFFICEPKTLVERGLIQPYHEPLIRAALKPISP